MSQFRLSLSLLIVPVLLIPAGCVTDSVKYREIESTVNEYDIRMLAKSDMSRVAELGQREVLKSLRKMMVRLYAANPEQLRRAEYPTIKSNVERIFGGQIRWNFGEFGGVSGNSMLHLSFDESYRGDRVLLFTAALVSMTMRSYNGTTELYMLDQLDPQKIHNSARNFEVALRMVEQLRTDSGEYYLNSGDYRMASLVGRAVANQDLMAILIADHTNRQLTGIVQSVAAMVLLPI